MEYLAVAIGGFFGAITRAGLGDLLQLWYISPFPFNTLSINLTGCFVLSFFYSITLERFQLNPKLSLAIGTGFLGAYTTFSTFSVESIKLFQGAPWYALAYLIVTPLGSVALAWLGAILGKRLATRQIVSDAE